MPPLSKSQHLEQLPEGVNPPTTTESPYWFSKCSVNRIHQAAKSLIRQIAYLNDLIAVRAYADRQGAAARSFFELMYIHVLVQATL